jgi:sigma-B regulation protein RsbU (phosphoserine phosphatase)
MVFWKKKGAPSTPSAPAAEVASSPGPKTEFLTGDAFKDRRSVQVLLDAIARVSESRDLDSLLDYVVDSSVEATGAERGFLVMLDDEGQQTVRVARQKGGADVPADDVKYSTSVVGRVLKEDAPMRTTVQSDAEALELGTSVFDLKLRAVMCVPLTPHHEHDKPSGLNRGALYVDSKAATREFKDEDLSLFFALAKHIAIALETANLNLQSLEKVKLERSLEIATEIQSRLIPPVAKSIPGFDVHGWYSPAEHATGDFYDFVLTRDKRLAVVVGDVTGHGIGPALITATGQASLRSYARVLKEPSEIIMSLNQDMMERMDDGMFLTLFLGIFAEDGSLRLVNAGQTPPLIWRHATKEIESIAGTGPAIGMMDEFEYTEGPAMTLHPGDLLVAFTDGLVEARHTSRPDRMFDESGIRAVLSDVGSRGLSAKEVTEEIVASVLEFTGGEREDDRTVVAVRRALDA